MAVFGLPQAHDDDATRALDAALDLRERLRADPMLGERLPIRIGLNTGEVVASRDPQRSDFIITGDAVNVAARLQQAAAGGETLLGDSTRRLIAAEFETEPVEPLAVRGKSEPLVAWRLAGAGALGRAEAAAPFQGREAELRALREAFERVAFERTPQRVVVLGPAGIGKSRLALELEGALRERASVLTGRCLPYGEGITFWALGEVFRQFAGGADPHAALVAALPAGPRAALVAERALQAAGLEEPTSAREDLTRAVVEVFEALARHRPLVLVLEDVHWAEPPLLDLVEHLLTRAQDAPILVLCLAREELLERRPEWRAGTPRSGTLELEPLPAGDTRALVQALLPRDAGAEAGEELAARAEGNPLFAEQLAALRREGGEPALPPTIQALLAARLDRLDPAARAAVGAAAVVGREFWGDAVEAALRSQGAQAVPRLLAELERRRLVMSQETTLESETGYAFTHALVRDAAYESLTKQDRAELHERVADWFEQRHPERMIELEPIVGYHLEQAYRQRTDLAPAGPHAYALAQRAARRLAAAGARAARAREDSAAAGLLERAADLLPAGAAERVALLPMIAEALEGTAEHARAGELYEQAIEAASAARDRRVEAYSRVRRAGVRFLIEPEADDRLHVAEAQAAIPALERERDDRGLAEAWRLIGEVRMAQGRAGEGRTALERALEHTSRTAAPRTWNAVLFEVGMCLLDGPAPLAEAVAFAQRQLDLARAEELRGVEADMLHLLGAGLGRQGDFDAGRAALEEASAISEELGLRYMAQWSRRHLGHLELAAGEPAAAERVLRDSWDVLTEMGLNSSLGETAVPLAEAVFEQGRHEEAAEVLRAVKDEWASGDASIAGPRLAMRARLQAAEGFPVIALQTAERALRVVRPTDLLCLRADTLLVHAEVARIAGEEETAAAGAADALRISRAKGYAVGLARARVEAAQA